MFVVYVRYIQKGSPPLQNFFVNSGDNAIISQEPCENLEKPSWAAYSTVRKWPSGAAQNGKLVGKENHTEESAKMRASLLE